MATASKNQKPESGRGAKKAAESLGFLAIIAVVLVLANVVGQFFFTRIDLTPNKIFTLADGSERLVSDLEEDLEVTVYYTSDLQGEWAAHERYVRDILSEYESAGGARFKLRWVDPDEEEEKEEAREAGIIEDIRGGSSTTSMTIARSFAGIVIQYVGEREVINFAMPSTMGLEYEISSRIQRLVRDKLRVGLVTGHGSPTLTQGLSALRTALRNYEIVEVDVSEEIDRELRALLIIDPTESFSDTELRRINQFVMRGGSLAIFGGGLNVSLQGQMGPSATAVDTDLNQLLRPWGVEIGAGMVADAQSEQVPMRGPLGLPVPVPFPPIPRIVFDDQAQAHPVTFRVNYAPFFFSSPIRTTNVFDRLEGVTLARSTVETSWILSESSIQLTPRHPAEWRQTIGERRGPFNLLVAMTAQLPSAFAGAGAMSSADGEAPPTIEAPARSEQPVRVLVAGSGWFLHDELMGRDRQGNVQLSPGLIIGLNAIDWLAQDADLIAVRAKSIDEPPIRAPERLAAEEAQAQAEQAQAELNAAAVEGDQEGAQNAQAAARRAQEQLHQATEAYDRKKLWYQILLTVGLPLLIAAFGLLRWWMRANKRASLQELRKKSAAKRAR